MRGIASHRTAGSIRQIETPTRARPGLRAEEPQAELLCSILGHSLSLYPPNAIEFQLILFRWKTRRDWQTERFIRATRIQGKRACFLLGLEFHTYGLTLFEFSSGGVSSGACRGLFLSNLDYSELHLSSGSECQPFYR